MDCPEYFVKLLTKFCHTVHTAYFTSDRIIQVFLGSIYIPIMAELIKSPQQNCTSETLTSLLYDEPSK